LFDVSALTVTRVVSYKSLENSSLADGPITPIAAASLVIRAYCSVYSRYYATTFNFNFNFISFPLILIGLSQPKDIEQVKNTYIYK
jgi:hypothetical protein